VKKKRQTNIVFFFIIFLVFVFNVSFFLDF